LWGAYLSIRAKAKGIMERREETSLCSFSISLSLSLLLSYLPSVYVSA